MSGPTERHPIALKRVVYEIPGMASAIVRRDVPYGTADAAAVTMDWVETTRLKPYLPAWGSVFRT